MLHNKRKGETLLLIVTVKVVRLRQHAYLVETFTSLLVLAPQAVGAAQVKEHHGPSRGHATGVEHRSLLACSANTHTHKEKQPKSLLSQGINQQWIQRKSKERCSRHVRLLAQRKTESSSTSEACPGLNFSNRSCSFCDSGSVWKSEVSRTQSEHGNSLDEVSLTHSAPQARLLCPILWKTPR